MKTRDYVPNPSDYVCHRDGACLLSPAGHLEFMRELVLEATKGVMLARRYPERLAIKSKGKADWVSRADRQAEHLMRQKLSLRYPGYAFWGEEEGASGQPDCPARWIIDPIDGTHNYLAGSDDFAVTLALEMEGELVASVMCAPLRQRMWWAARDLETVMICDPARPDDARSLPPLEPVADPYRWLVACGLGGSVTQDLLPMMGRLTSNCAGLRGYGASSLDLAGVAEGFFAAYIKPRIKLHDLAPGLMLALKAGAELYRFDGSDAEATDIPEQVGCVVAAPGVIDWLRPFLRNETAENA